MKHLTLDKRHFIFSLKNQCYTNKKIAELVGVSESTISRELRRNVTNKGNYSPIQAQELYEIRKERFNLPRKFTKEKQLIIDKYLKNEQWSPEQIKGHCDKKGIEMVSIERIYQYIREDKQNGGYLYKELRHQLKHRKRPVGFSNSKIPNRVSIDERPEIINNRQEFGHWEADLIEGANHSGFILTLTERVSKQLLMSYLPNGKNAEGVANTMIDLFLPYKNAVKSITMDNGMEFSMHENVAKKIGAKTYFTHPYSSWEKGQIEYTNKLIRQYYPKTKQINELNTKNIKEIQYKINRRPRKNLDYESPINIFSIFVTQKIAFTNRT